MEIIRFISAARHWEEWLPRQIPGGGFSYQNFKFVVGPLRPGEEYDYLVVYDDLPWPLSVKCPLWRSVFIGGEPEAIGRYPRGFLAQFAAVISCQERLVHPNIIDRFVPIPWWAGVAFKAVGKWEVRMGFDELQSVHPAKSKLLSVIRSGKHLIEGHKTRDRFIEAVKTRFGENVDVFGRGGLPFEDKWDAIAPYRYHIVIENSESRDYWTEKLADAFLAESMPIYAGCPNLQDYFPLGAYEALDIAAPEEALRRIESLISRDGFSSSTKPRSVSKDLVLQRYNIVPRLVAALKGLSPQHVGSQVLRPLDAFDGPPLRRLKRRLQAPTA